MTAASEVDTGVHETAADAVRVIDQVRRHRARIDEIDGRVIELVQERAALSAWIQTARMSSGGTRLSHARENQIIRRYQNALGSLGPDLAQLLLKLSRGPR